MNIYFALCGNNYSEILCLSFLSDRSLIFVHRSNLKTKFEKLYSALQLFFVVALRHLVLPIIGGKIIMLVPHAAGNYGKIIKILKPNNYILIDDGITFEYWSKFHDQYISPVYFSSKTILLLGPRLPNWNERNSRTLPLHLISRKKITEDILKIHAAVSSNDKIEISESRIGWLVDDGELSQELIDQLEAMILSTFECDSIRILWHPARCRESDGRMSNQPAEVSILSSNVRPMVVVGKASTTLFNVVAYDLTIQVATLTTGYSDLDQVAREQGISIIEVYHAHN